MRVVILGSGSPRPQRWRSQPSVLVEEGTSSLLVDCGEGTVHQIQEWGHPIASVDSVLLTHLHSDHTLGYGHFLLGGWALGRRQLNVFGPEGTRRFHDLWLQQLYPEDVAYRLSLGRTPDGLTEKVAVTESKGPTSFGMRPFEVACLPVLHVVPTFAYRISGPSGQTVVISGDTAYFPDLANWARGADVLVHEAALAPTPIYASEQTEQTGDVSWQRLTLQHSTPAQAGAIARQAQAGALILTHLPPGADLAQSFLAAHREFAGDLALAEDFLAWEDGRLVGPRER